MYKTVLEIEGKSYIVSSINLNTYNRGSGYDPSPNDQQITVQIKTIKMDQNLWDWATSDDIKKKNGRIIIVDTESNKTVQTVEFEAGFCSGYNLSFYANNDYNNETGLTISADKVRVQASQVDMQPGAIKD